MCVCVCVFRRQYKLISIRAIGIVAAEKHPVYKFRLEANLHSENGGSTFFRNGNTEAIDFRFTMNRNKAT
jgi:hypothetical protein